MNSCVLFGVDRGEVYDRGVYSMKRILRRKVTLEMSEEYLDGSWKDREIEVVNVDTEDRSLGMDKMLMMALAKLGENENGR